MRSPIITNVFKHTDAPDFSRNDKAGQKADLTTLKTDFIRQYITRKIDFDGKAGLSFMDSFTDESLIRPVLEAAFSYQIETFPFARLLFTKKTGTNPYIRVLTC